VCYTRLQLTSRRHWRKIPPLDMFFSASSSPKLSELAKMRTSAMFTSRCRNDTATSIGIPCVGSITSSSLWKQLHASTESCVVHSPSLKNSNPTTDTITHSLPTSLEMCVCATFLWTHIACEHSIKAHRFRKASFSFSPLLDCQVWEIYLPGCS